MSQFALSKWWGWPFRFRAGSKSAPPREPTEEELLSAVLAEPRGEDRRRAVRHLCGRTTRCRGIALMECPSWPAVIRDISTSGVGLVTDDPPEPGTFLTVELKDRWRVPVQVVGARFQGNGEWLVGCVLLRPLHPEDLAAVI